MTVRRCRFMSRCAVLAALMLASLLAGAGSAAAQAPAPPAAHAGGEANLVLPDLGQVEFQGVNGRTLLMGGLGGLRARAWRSAW